MSEKPKSTPKPDPGYESAPQTPWEIRERLFDSSLSPEERMKAVFGEKAPTAKVEKAPELDPKLKERVERAIKTMYEQIEKSFTPSFKGHVGEYEVVGVNYGNTRYVNFDKGGKTLQFWFDAEGVLIDFFDTDEKSREQSDQATTVVALYLTESKQQRLPNAYRGERYLNVELLVEKLEKFSALLETLDPEEAVREF